MRTLAALMILSLLAGCATLRECPVPKAPETVTVTVEKFRPLPDWAKRQLPEDAPRANTVDEAKRLASDRLKTIQAENCRNRLLAKLDQGDPVDEKECKR